MAKPQALIQAGGIRALSRSIRIMVDKDLGDEMRAASRAAAIQSIRYRSGLGISPANRSAPVPRNREAWPEPSCAVARIS